jgi:hypothetical protein
MKAYIVEAQDRPGELAKVADALGSKGINIVSIAGLAFGGRGAVGVCTNDEQGTRAALSDAGYTAREVELVPIALRDEPGALAKAARRLADAGVNIELLLPTRIGADGKVTVAAGVQDAERARSALGDLATAATERA